MNSTDFPLVTIAIPTFNRAASFFPLALASARSQSYSNTEILVSDNASSDNTRAIVEDCHDQRIRYHRHDVNIGQIQNEAFCLNEARGTFLVILPDDDLMDSDFIEACVTLSANNNSNVGVIRAGTRVIDGKGKLLRDSINQVPGLSFDELALAWLDGTTSPYQCSSMFRTDALRAEGLQSRHHLYNDLMAHFKVAAHHGHLDIAPVKASFRIHGDSATDLANMRYWCEESHDLLALLCDLCHTDKELIRTRCLRFLAESNYRRALRKSFPESLFACMTVLRMHRFKLPSRSLAKAFVKNWARQFKRMPH